MNFLKKIFKKNKKECFICYKNIYKHNKYELLCCNKEIHYNCANECKKLNNKCPNCRQNLEINNVKQLIDTCIYDYKSIHFILNNHIKYSEMKNEDSHLEDLLDYYFTNNKLGILEQSERIILWANRIKN